MDSAITAATKKKKKSTEDMTTEEVIAQSQKNIREGKSYNTGQTDYHGEYVPKRKPKGPGGGQFSAENDAASAQDDSERQSLTSEREKRTTQRQDEDANRGLKRAEEDAALAQHGRNVTQLKQVQAKKAAAAKALDQLYAQRKTARGDRGTLYDDAIKKATADLEGLGKDEADLIEKTKAAGVDVAALRDKVHLARKTEDIARTSTRHSEDAAARAASQDLQNRIKARRAERRARQAETRAAQKASVDPPDPERIALTASLRLRRRRMLVRAGLTADLSERAMLQASAAAVGRDLAAVMAGAEPPFVRTSALTASAGFDGAAIVLLADQGSVTYPDGTSAPLHVTLTYLGPAAEMTPIEVDAATNAAKRLAGTLDPFTPSVLSPARFGDTDVLLLEHPDIQRAHDVLMANRSVAGLARHDVHPHFVPHCSGALTAPRLGRAALLMAGEQREFPLIRQRPLTASLVAVGDFNPDLHPRGHDGKFIKKFGLVDLLGMHGFQHGQRGDTSLQGQVVDIIADPSHPGDPVIRVKITDPRWDPAKFGATVDVRRNKVQERATPKAKIPGPDPTPSPVPAPTVAPTFLGGDKGGPITPRTPTPAMVPAPDGPGFAPLEPPSDWDSMPAAARNAWVTEQMTTDFTAWRGKETHFDFEGFHSQITLNLANTYRDLANWDPDTARRIDYPIVRQDGDMGASLGDLGSNAIAVAMPGTAHPGGIGPKIGPAGMIFGRTYMRDPQFWIDQKKSSDAKTLPFSTSSMTGDASVTLIHEFGHQRQFRFLDIAMNNGVGKAWSPVVREDGFGLVPDSSNWPETQALRYAIPKATPTEYGQSKTSEGFAEAWAARMTGNSSPELDALLDQWDELMGVSLDLPAERFDTSKPFDSLTPEEQSAFWQETGPMFELPGMREHYPDSADSYDAWVATSQAGEGQMQQQALPQGFPEVGETPLVDDPQGWNVTVVPAPLVRNGWAQGGLWDVKAISGGRVMAKQGWTPEQVQHFRPNDVWSKEVLHKDIPGLAQTTVPRWIPGVGDVDAYLAAHPRLPDEPLFDWHGRIVDGLSPSAKHALIFEVRERYEPVAFLAEGMTRWRQEHGLPEPTVNITDVPAPQLKAYAVARAFEDAPDASDDPEVQAVFAEFKRQSEEMFTFMTTPESEGGLGVVVEFWTDPEKQNFGDGPYNSGAEQAEDLRVNHHIFLESGLGGEHQGTMSRDEYDRFRAVHDVFGHAGIGGGFDRHGEYQAYLAHASMYWGDGERGMASEYHGVNTAMWTGAPGTPGTGKSVLLPEVLIAPPWAADGTLAPLPGIDVLSTFADLSPVMAAGAQVPDAVQLDVLRIDAGTAAALAYLAEQLGLDPLFAQHMDRPPLHFRQEPPPFSDAVTAAFSPDLHPRGHDGRFIEIGGLLEILSGPDKHKRGRVESIKPPKNPGLTGRCAVCGDRIQRNGTTAPWRHQRPNPDGSPRDHVPVLPSVISVRLDDGRVVDVKPNDVQQAPEKAQIPGRGPVEPPGVVFHPESWGDADKMNGILAEQLGLTTMEPLEGESMIHPRSGFQIEIGRKLSLAFDRNGPDEQPAVFNIVDRGTPDAEGNTVYEDGTPAYTYNQVLGQQPIEFLYRGMSQTEYEQAKQRGYIQSDQRGTFPIPGGEGTNAATEPIHALSYVSRHEPSRIVKIRVRPEDGWFAIEADGYVRSRGQIPFDQVEAVSQRIGHDDRGPHLIADQAPAAPAAPPVPMPDGVVPMTRADLSNPDTPRTRQVTEEEYAALATQGQARLNELKGSRSPAGALEGPSWDTIKQQAWDSVHNEGGITIDTHTGVAADEGFAITIRPGGTKTVVIPATATREDFDAAMEEAKKRWSANIFQMGQVHLGAFRNDPEIGTFEIDPVLVVDNLSDVETIGSFTHAEGGAFSFSDSLGYWPPYVA